MAAQQRAPTTSNRTQVRTNNGLGTLRGRIVCSLVFIFRVVLIVLVRPPPIGAGRINNTGQTAKVSGKLFDLSLRFLFFGLMPDRYLPAAGEFAQKLNGLKLIGHGEGDTVVAKEDGDFASLCLDAVYG